VSTSSFPDRAYQLSAWMEEDLEENPNKKETTTYHMMKDDLQRSEIYFSLKRYSRTDLKPEKIISMVEYENEFPEKIFPYDKVNEVRGWDRTGEKHAISFQHPDTGSLEIDVDYQWNIIIETDGTEFQDQFRPEEGLLGHYRVFNGGTVSFVGGVMFSENHEFFTQYF